MSIYPLLWDRLVSLEGDTSYDVSLLPFQASFIGSMILLVRDNPSVFFKDYDEMDIDYFESVCDDILNKMSSVGRD